MIRLLLALAAAFVLVNLLAARASASIRAGRRVLFVLLTVGFALAALQPALVDRVARSVGVGRGADLVLYALATAFLYLVLFIYQKFKEQERRTAELVRHLALLQASQEHRGGTTGAGPSV